MSDQKKYKPSKSLATKPCAIDLFSGCGGLTLGLKKAGFRVIGAIEKEAPAVIAYKTNHRGVLIKNSDICQVSPLKLRRELNLRRGQLDLLAGCPPCQGFSVLRNKNGGKKIVDSRNNLTRQMLRFIEEFLPKTIMMENVPKLKNRQQFYDLCKGLRGLGYEISYDVKDAAQYGVPQRRQRLILLAGRGFEIPFAKESKKIRTVKDAIGHLPKAGKSGDTLHDIPEKKRNKRILRLIQDIPKDGGSRSDLPKSRQLACHKRSDGFKDVYGRMAWNTVAPTITGGCFNPSKGRFLHPKENRAITMREAAMLQSFPQNYNFPSAIGKVAIALMIGNALPPKCIQSHALEIKKTLRYRSSAKYL